MEAGGLRTQFLTQKKLDYQNWKLGVQVLVKGLHLIEVGQIYLLELTSKMNSGRLTSNQTKFKSISGPAIDIFSYPPLYKFVGLVSIQPDGEIKVISSGRTVTEAKFYKLTPYSKTVSDINTFNISNNLEHQSIKPLYLKNKLELCHFFGLSDVTIYKSINKGLPLTPQEKTTGLTYTITKIY